ncbi:aminoacyl-tRNA hydrolase [Candidatus Phytoplasma fraxini]|uniref:Peptidyl-tRNA hydrolase n=1 Tax=Ash yellows phytoplasma TaxID=35780 RepID=A0ABZ2U893_ASHYP
MKLIVGLGNPGYIYDNTPHNIGFMMIDFFLDYLYKQKYQIQTEILNSVYQLQMNEKKIILFKPQKYMNLSGIAINEIMHKYKINIKDILVLYDDIYLKAGFFKLKEKSGHGGHNGIRNIIDILRTDQFKRLKIGVEYNSSVSLNKYVLGNFDVKIKENIFNKFSVFIDILLYFIEGLTIEKILNLVNKN